MDLLAHSGIVSRGASAPSWVKRVAIMPPLPVVGYSMVPTGVFFSAAMAVEKREVMMMMAIMAMKIDFFMLFLLFLAPHLGEPFVGLHTDRLIYLFLMITQIIKIIPSDYQTNE
jgi:hypothetical protein